MKCPKCGANTAAGCDVGPEWFCCPTCGCTWFNDEYKVSSSIRPHESLNGSTGRYEFTDL